MPISLRLFVLFTRPAFSVLKLVRFEFDGPLHGPRVADAQQAELVRELSRRLNRRLGRDVLRDE
jgi:hypothetical protein